MDQIEAMRELMAEIAFAVFVVDESGRYVDGWSKREDELILPVAETLGKTVRDMLPRTRAIEVEALIAAAISTGQVQRVAFPVEGGPTGTLHLEAVFRAMDTADGPRVAIALVDYSDLERLERELRRAERQYRAVLDNAPDAVVVLDVASGSFCEGNDRALELFELTREQLLVSTVADLSPPEQPDGRASADAAAEWLALTIAGERPVFDWVHRTGDGKDIQCEVRLVRLPTPEGILVRGSVVDVSERRALEDEMRRCRERCKVLAGRELREIHAEISALCAGPDTSGSAVRLREAARRLEVAIDQLESELGKH